ncbi:MAG: DASH family cryptochrome [Burkholderiales bacterium]|nr:DASH family cryptochrome [Flavobacterium sp.]
MANLVWFRNDLRVQDNVSLWEARKTNGRTIGIYCIDPRQFQNTTYGFKKTEQFRARFLLETLAELKTNLEKNNISLMVFYDLPENCLPGLVTEHAITKIYTQAEWTSEELEVNKNIQKKLQNVEWIATYDQFLFHPSDIPYPNFHAIPAVFTDFRKQCEKLSKVRPCVSLAPKGIENLVENSTAIPTLTELGFEPFETETRSAFPFKGGENQALKRIQSYFWETNQLRIYKKTRNGLIGTDYSSKLSAWLGNGSISARTIYWEIKRYEKEITKNEDTYWLFFELIWRDYFKYISLKHGNKIFQIDGILQKDYVWGNNQKAFQQWTNGRTTEPFVNANMIELQKTGWMSNRGRQNVASYWAKEWQQDWRIGAAYFESFLIDYDVHSNYGNWIYNSGVGNDPRDRKFNIKRQAEMYDASGKFQQLWLTPELF